jgi:hypothetical protein
MRAVFVGIVVMPLLAFGRGVAEGQADSTRQTRTLDSLVVRGERTKGSALARRLTGPAPDRHGAAPSPDQVPPA